MIRHELVDFSTNIHLPLRKLEDSEAAEQYCAEIGRPDAYMQLVSFLPPFICYSCLNIL